MLASHSLNTSTSAPPEHFFSSGCLSQRLSTQPTPAHASAVVLFLLPAAPYGYRINPENKKELVIVEDEAEVIRREIGRASCRERVYLCV